MFVAIFLMEWDATRAKTAFLNSLKPAAPSRAIPSREFRLVLFKSIGIHLQPISIELITAAVVSTGVPIWSTFKPSTAPLNRNGTQTLRIFAPPRRLREITTLNEED